MVRKNIAIIGIGHIGRALTIGILGGLSISPNRVILSNPNLDELIKLRRKYKLRLTADNRIAAAWADILILAVRPKVVRQVVSQIRDYLKKDTLIISVAACVTFALLEKYFESDTAKIVRIMPNIPVAYGRGVIGWIGNNQVDRKSMKLIKSLLSPLGYLTECKTEECLDKLTVISSCGSGYFGYIINSIEKVAKECRFSQEEARNIVRSTFYGTLYHLQATNMMTSTFVSSVATNGGITQDIIRNMEKNNFYRLLVTSIKKGYDRIGKITKELENDYLR